MNPELLTLVRIYLETIDNQTPKPEEANNK